VGLSGRLSNNGDSHVLCVQAVALGDPHIPLVLWCKGTRSPYIAAFSSRISAHHRREFDFLLIDDHDDRDCFRLVAIRQRLGQGPRGLTTAVPGDQDMLSRSR
jgi:hypothetical protein